MAFFEAQNYSAGAGSGSVNGPRLSSANYGIGQPFWL